jgi:hypothetical protein
VYLTRGSSSKRQPVDPNETFRKQYLEMRETYLEARLKSIALKPAM